jgi:serine/threonine-protein kinase
VDAPVEYSCTRCWSSVERGATTCAACSLRRPEEGWAAGPLGGRLVGAGKYRLVAPLGAGGFGCTGKAVQLLDGRPLGTVAIKFPLRRAAGFSVEDFLEEACALRAVAHPNIVVLHDAFVEDGVPYLVMEHVAGETLDREAFLRRGTSLESIIHLATQIAAGADAVHSKGVVHCDLKPGNVAVVPWLDHTPSFAKILDFGLACLWQRGRGWQGGWAGTPGFAPPEQILGAPTPRSDVFAFGVTLFWLLTGRLPFDPRLVEDPERFRREAPPSLPSALPAELDALIRECLEPDEERRYPVMPIRPLHAWLAGGASPLPDDAPSQQATLGTAKDLFLRAGLAENKAEKRSLYARAAELFQSAEKLGPLPDALKKFAAKARQYSSS